MRFKPYPKYKPSGVEWLEDVPKGWTCAPLKRGYRVCLGKMLQPEQKMVTDVVIPYLRAANIKWDYVDTNDVKTMYVTQKEIESLALLDGDLLVSEGGDVGRSAIWRNEIANCCIQNSVNRIRPIGRNSNRFLFYWMRTIKEAGYIDVLCNKSTIAHFTAEKVETVPVPFPEPDEQNLIVTFLDRETAKIDTLIARQEKLIDLLKEKRQAVISHAISDENCGSRMPLKRYVDLLPGYAFPSDQYTQDEDDVRLVRGINVAVGRLRWDEIVYWSKNNLEKLTPFFLKNGDVLFGMDRPWISEGARIAIVTASDLPLLLVQRVCRLRSLTGMTQSFLHLILSSQEFRDFIEVDLTGVSVPHISPDQILSFRAFIPSEHEQADLCKRVSSQFLRIDTLIAKAEQAIALQKEHRAALIAAAVTGKIDVRGEVQERKVA